MAEDVLRVKVRVLERDGGDEVDEPREVREGRSPNLPSSRRGRGDSEIAVPYVLLLHRLQRVADELVGGGDFVRVGVRPTLLEDFRAGRELGGISSAARTPCGMAAHYAGAHLRMAVLEGLRPRQLRGREDVFLDVIVAFL